MPGAIRSCFGQGLPGNGPQTSAGAGGNLLGFMASRSVESFSMTSVSDEDFDAESAPDRPPFLVMMPCLPQGSVGGSAAVAFSRRRLTASRGVAGSRNRAGIRL
eukprot:7491679-Pyramimonas_sp.AAC.1